MIVINKLDRERADFERVLDEVRATFGAGVAPVELPIGHETDFHGVIDLLDDTATHYDTPARGFDATHRRARGPIPDDLVDEEHDVHEQLVEGIVVGDDDLTTRYLEGETHRRTPSSSGPRRGVASASVFPVLCGSALSGVGVDRLARLVESCARAPATPTRSQAWRGHETVEIACDPAGRRSSRCARPVRPAHGPALALQGGVGHAPPRRRAVNTRTRSEERLHVARAPARALDGPVSEAVAGRLRRRAPARRDAAPATRWRRRGRRSRSPSPCPSPPRSQSAVKPARGRTTTSS